jgi:hypothetical protein
MSPRLTDWSIALAIGIAFMTGVVSLIAGHPQEWLVFVLLANGGFLLLLLSYAGTRGALQRSQERLSQYFRGRLLEQLDSRSG